MKLGNLFFILSIIGILLLIFISQNQPIQTGKIQSIEQSTNKITITLENSTTKLILFEKEAIKINEGDLIEFRGEEEIYKGEKQIIVDRILKCSP